MLSVVHPRLAVLGQDRVRPDRVGKATQRLQLLAPLEVARHRVGAAHLGGTLDREVVELAEIGEVARDPGNGLVDLEVVVCGVEPDPVLLDRPPDVGVPFPEAEVGLTGEASARRVGVDVVADEAFVFPRDVVERLELVAAALDRREHGRARRHHRHIAARRADGNLFVGEEVLIDAGAAGPFRRVHAVGHDPVLVAHAEALVAHLLALMTAADVEPQHPDARRLPQGGPDVRRRRNGRQPLGAELGADLGRGDIDDRRISRDGHRFLQCGNGHADIDIQGLSEREHDVLAPDGLKTGQLERQHVATGRQRWKAVAAVGLGDGGLCADQCRRLGGDGDSGEHALLGVGHDALQAALFELRGIDRESEKDAQTERHDGSAKI